MSFKVANNTALHDSGTLYFAAETPEGKFEIRATGHHSPVAIIDADDSFHAIEKWVGMAEVER